MKRGFLALLILGTACATPVAQNYKRHGGHVERASFTTAVKNREPVDMVRELHNDQVKIYYFTELMNMAGQTVTHRWTFNGKTMAEVDFEVGGPRWRVKSSKWLQPHWLGTWTASVINGSGRTVASSTFAYTQAESKGDVPAAPDPDQGILKQGVRGAQSFLDRMFGDD